MRTWWLNVVLRLTNLVYARKQRVVIRSGTRAAFDVLALVLLEATLAVFSIPLYVGMRPATATAFFTERGAFGEIEADYRVRRVLTLTGVSVALLVWVAKLAAIIVIPAWLGPLQLYTVSPLAPADLQTQRTLAAAADAETARVDRSLVVPSVTAVARGRGDSYTFHGTGTPNATVVLLVASPQTFMLTDTVAADGTWEMTHAQRDVRLEPGNHELAAYHYDAGTRTRSALSSPQYVKIVRGFADALLERADAITNWTVVTIILLGVFFTILTVPTSSQPQRP